MPPPFSATASGRGDVTAGPEASANVQRSGDAGSRPACGEAYAFELTATSRRSAFLVSGLGGPGGSARELVDVRYKTLDRLNELGEAGANCTSVAHAEDLGHEDC